MKLKYDMFIEVLRNKINPIFTLILIAFCVRLVALTPNYLIASDSVFYIKMAQLLSTGEYHHTLIKHNSYYAFFPFLIMLFNKVTGDWVLAGQFISIFLGTLTVIPLYLLGRRIFDEKIALFGAFFYCINPDLVKYSTEVLRDIPYGFFLILALWLGFKGIKEEKLFFLGLAGLLIALSASFRIEGLALLVCLTAFFIWNSIKNKISWGRLVTSIGLLWIVPFSFLILFGFMFNQKGVKLGFEQINKSKMPMSKLLNKHFERVEKEIDTKSFSRETKHLVDLAIEHRFVLYASNIFYKKLKVFKVLFLLFLFGLIKRRVVKYRQDEFLLFTIYAVFSIVFFLCMYLTNYLSVRHTLPVVAFSLIWCGVGFVELTERLKSWLEARDFQLKKMTIRILNPLILILFCIPLLSMAWEPIREDKLELKEIGLWLKNNGYDHSNIVGEEEFSRLAFYAESEFILLENKKYTDLSTYSREKNASLLVINKNTISNLSPNFFKLVSKGAFRPIHIPKIKAPKYATQVFEINKIK